MAEQTRTINLTPQPAELFTIWHRMLTSVILELDKPVPPKRRESIKVILTNIRDELLKYPKPLQGVTWEQFANCGDAWKALQQLLQNTEGSAFNDVDPDVRDTVLEVLT